MHAGPKFHVSRPQVPFVPQCTHHRSVAWLPSLWCSNGLRLSWRPAPRHEQDCSRTLFVEAGPPLTTLAMCELPNLPYSSTVTILLLLWVTYFLWFYICWFCFAIICCSGRHPSATHVWDLFSYFRNVSHNNFTTIPQFFKENGYTTQGFGKVLLRAVLPLFVVVPPSLRRAC